MDDMSGGLTGCTDRPIRPAKETNTDEFLKPKQKKVSKLKNQPRDDFQLDMTNRYDSLADKDSDKDTDQPEPKKKQNKNNTSQDKLATETANTDNDTTTTRIPKYMVPIIIDKTLDYNRLITFTQQEIKVLTTTTQAYNTAKDALKKKQNIHLHTFAPREEKSHSAILKGLPASIDIDIIKQEITEHHIHFQYIEHFTSKTGQGPERTIRKQGIFKCTGKNTSHELTTSPSVPTVRGGDTQKTSVPGQPDALNANRKNQKNTTTPNLA
ncbi:hypothetical protein PR048_017273 [Dryococelus australis]|uniref:Uncharacterized protein n=1 Tax=Dryococelus australis TaxID=614101 RepID=A0ABQ9H925_9NEOP|nr:hypothetical protein PR048_017273 [Dryococelus australis]